MTVREAGPDDAAVIAELRTAAADALTTKFGRGSWSSPTTERGALHALRHAKVLLLIDRHRPAGVLRLARKKPWAIDVSYFTACTHPVYLTDMAVTPERQGRGLGRLLLEHAREVARAWPGEAVRLDAYDAPAGAGGFYARCGFEERGRVSYRGTPLVYFEQRL